MEEVGKKTLKWSKKKIITIAAASVVVLGVALGIVFTLNRNINRLGIVGKYMDMTGVSEETLFVSKKGKKSLPGVVYANEEVAVYNDVSTNYEDAVNVEFVLQVGEDYTPIKYYNNNNRIDNVNNYLDEITIPDGWYISTYSLTEKFIFVKFQYNFDGVQFTVNKFLNMFGVYNSSLEFHYSTKKIAHEVVAIDRDTGLVSSLVDVMINKGYLMRTGHEVYVDRAGDMFIIEFDYSNLADETATYTVGMYRGEVFVISSNEEGGLEIRKIITLAEIKEKIAVQLAKYIEVHHEHVPDEVTANVNKFLNSNQNQIEYSSNSLNFFVDVNGDVLIYLGSYIVGKDENNSYFLYERIYGAAYMIDDDFNATYLAPTNISGLDQGYKIIDSVIIGSDLP